MEEDCHFPYNHGIIAKSVEEDILAFLWIDEHHFHNATDPSSSEVGDCHIQHQGEPIWIVADEPAFDGCGVVNIAVFDLGRINMQVHHLHLVRGALDKVPIAACSVTVLGTAADH